ncbi:hypothetical protein [Streptomyces sp. NRRL S-1824]|uniref:hypothetical protein n=1 Tax=Streptomyces sp. NRRL S-1824 TaxID=1463889 RepID=UPI000A796148|nr:hypothetical protein [Streptomyces sp. NRRL S-1824]
MHWYVVVPFVVMSMFAAVGGIVAIRTGWVLPWLRAKVFRPRLWGYASLLIAACLAVEMFDSPKTHFPFGDLGMAGTLIALSMVMVAGRPDRAR